MAPRIAYATAVAALGALLVSKQFVFVWAPIQKWVPGRDVLSVVLGALLVVLAVGLGWRKTVARAGTALAIVFAGWLVLLQAPRIAVAPGAEFLWAGGAQIATAIAAAWIAAGRAPRPARVMFAVALLPIGLHHFLAEGAVGAVPAWLPFRLGWLYLTGAAHIAAGLAILVGIVPRWAAMLEAIMIAGFVLLVHVPGVIDAPADPLQWTMLVVASVIGAAAWVVAASYRRR